MIEPTESRIFELDNKKYVIAEAHFHFKESYALSWAEYEIISHKQNLKRLEKAINV